MKLVVALACLGVRSSAAAPAKPNVLTLLTDDQGWGDNEFNCDNSTCASNSGQCCPHTPNIHAFAKDPHTALLHRFYAAASVCSPTRAAVRAAPETN
jgi:arylsulfatase A-like enzyme